MESHIEVAPPALGPDGSVYLPPIDGRAYALNGATGAVRWTFPLGRGRSTTASCAVSAEGTVYFGADDLRVYAVNGATGRKAWEFVGPDDGSVVNYSAPTIGGDGTVYIGALLRSGGGGTAAGRLYALDPATGRKRWEFPFEANASLFVNPLEPVIGGDGTIYLASANRIYAMR